MAGLRKTDFDDSCNPKDRGLYRAYYSALSRINELILRDTSTTEVTDAICEAIASISPRVCAFFASPDGESDLYLVTSGAGQFVQDSLLKELKEGYLSDRVDKENGRGIVGQVLRNGRTVLWTPTQRELNGYKKGQFYIKLGVRRVLGIPVFRDTQCIGILIVGALDTDILDPNLINLCERLCRNAGYLSNVSHQRYLLQQQCFTDALTGLPNRALCIDRLRTEISRSRREKKKFAVVTIDLDALREVNDESGHKMGDSIITTMASRISDSLDDHDTLARYAGDTFVAFIHLQDTTLALGSILDRLVACIRKPVDMEGSPARITASIGAAVFPDAADDAPEILRRSELAMHRRKAAGGDGWNIFETGVEEQVIESLSLKKSFIHAIESGEIIFYYQPIVDMSKGLVVGAEALARWRHSERGLIPPDKWIPFVEGDSRLISLLGRYALKAGLRQLANWHAQGLQITLSINIGAGHFLSDHFLDDVKDALSEAPPAIIGFLALEITESAMVTDFSRLSDVLRKCRKLGVRISLDDFGTGHGSLVYLQKLPADHLKIDLEFVTSLPWSIRAFSIIAGTLQISRLSSVTVLAEGVETEEHGIRLLQMGCQYAQGFAISPALEVDRFWEWVISWSQPASWRALAATPPLPDTMQLLAGLVYHRSRRHLLLPALETGHNGNLDELHELAHVQCPLESWHLPGHLPLLPIHEDLHERIHRLETHGTNLVLSGKNPGAWLAEVMRRRAAIFENAMEQRIVSATAPQPLYENS